jgi:hypothetical protein
MKSLLLIVLFLLPTSGYGEEVKFSLESNGGATMDLFFPDKVTLDTATARLCTTKSEKLVEAKLWMKMGNGHEHGSTPTKIKKLANNCWKIDDLNFLMAGKWQIIMKFDDQDGGTFLIPVARH